MAPISGYLSDKMGSRLLSSLGMVMGVAISGAVFQTALPFHIARMQAQGFGGSALESGAFVRALQNSYWVAIALASLGVFTSLVRGGSFTKALTLKERGET